MPHRQSLKDRWRLKEGKPRVSNRQENHGNNLHGSHEFPREDTGIGDVLANQCNGAHQKADEIGLDKGPLDLSVVDLAGTINDQPLCQNKRTAWSDECTEDIEFSVVFPQKDGSKRRRKHKAKDTDDNGGRRVNQK